VREAWIGQGRERVTGSHSGSARVQTVASEPRRPPHHRGTNATSGTFPASAAQASSVRGMRRPT
jgi:hypothetical protein